MTTAIENPAESALDPPPQAPHDAELPPRHVATDALARLFRPIRRHLVGCAILSTLGSAAGFAPYIAVAEIARVALASTELASVSATLWTWTWIGMIGAGLRLVLVFASSRLGHYADARTLHDLRVRMIRQLGSLPLGWFRASGSGAVKKRMTTDLEDMHLIIAHALGELVGAATAITVGLGYLLFVDWRMALVTAGVLLVMVVAYRIAMRSMSTHMNRLLTAEERISAASIEYADGIAVVKAFGTGGRILERFNTAVRQHTAALGAWAAETRYSTALSRLCSAEVTVLGVVTIAGLIFVHNGHLAMAELIPFLVVGVGLPTSIDPAIQGSLGVRKGRVAAGNVDELLSRPPLPEPVRPASPQGHQIELDRVTFSYDGVTNAVADVTATLAPGTITALVGPSGAGKSTIASLLPRFYDVTDGAIRIGGTDIRDIPTTELLSSMSLVFQDVMLLRDTVRENIRIGRPLATDEEVQAAARAARIHEVITRLPDGYDTVLGDGGGLSGGERQRLTIARAILSGAPVVILDEATASLDPDGETAVQAALAELAVGKTVIVIAHRLHTISAADQILVLDDGQLAERGSHEQLLARNGRYARMWEAQLHGRSA
ncbi:ATP-binding cassette subfamily B protein [Tamaricihabitans halophyticus]|uniref:ATP-binding cassette subfamily B protein n=1 Tax=Tamaricihabitans halophyticus TaxID=1262583 RepID=A0A4V2STB5_9PSEU|nr:ABC transporter ATP-binding protein [Tamaricihabitans halophyticus]TCP49996.1 ATP-binding cassette subfamily B protein [Tamaricihabitans halophyticus]